MDGSNQHWKPNALNLDPLDQNAQTSGRTRTILTTLKRSSRLISNN